METEARWGKRLVDFVVTAASREFEVGAAKAGFWRKIGEPSAEFKLRVLGEINTIEEYGKYKATIRTLLGEETS